MEMVAAGLAVVLGALVCFLGYRLLRVTLAVVGFAVGAVLAGTIASSFAGVAQVFVLIIALVGGILGAVLSAVLYKAGVFLLGAGAGALVAGIIIAGTGGTPKVLILVLSGVAGGIVTLLLQRALVSVLTAFAGAWGAVAGVFQLAGWYQMSFGYEALQALRSSVRHFGLMVACWVVLGALGSIVQLSQARKKK